MLTISVILIIVSILLVIYSVYALKHTHQINLKVDKQNQELQHAFDELDRRFQKRSYELKNLSSTLASEQDRLYDIQNNISKTLDNQKEMSQKAFENYCQVLEKQYDEYEEEYDMYKNALETSYSNRQLELMRELAEVQEDLNQIKATRDAARQAITREKEIEEQLSFYCLQIPEVELKDIAVLESIKSKLANPRILSMLIWQTFWQKPMNTLCANIIGTNTKSGIYKITNQKTKECYIGQAVDLATRWKQHAKCGLGIDTPAGNLLYKSMMEFGIWNFSWEVLEEVPPAQLNEKEAYYIDLYDSKNYGYNQNKGVTK